MTPDDPKIGVTDDDGDLPPESELWTRINNETEMLRKRTTPMYVQQRILSALPDPPPKAQQESNRLKISPGIISAIVIVLLIVGLLLGMVLRTQ